MPIRRNANRRNLGGDEPGADQRRARIGEEGLGEEFSAISAGFYNALTIDSVIFLASPSSIMVLGR
jgi:hypothetical protein